MSTHYGWEAVVNIEIIQLQMCDVRPLMNQSGRQWVPSDPGRGTLAASPWPAWKLENKVMFDKLQLLCNLSHDSPISGRSFCPSLMIVFSTSNLSIHSNTIFRVPVLQDLINTINTIMSFHESCNTFWVLHVTFISQTVAFRGSGRSVCFPLVQSQWAVGRVG